MIKPSDQAKGGWMRWLPFGRTAQALAKHFVSADRGGMSANHKRHGITEEERRAYREEGYFVRERVFLEDDLGRLREAVERVHKRILNAKSDADPIQRLDGGKFQTTLGSVVKWEWADEERAIRSMEPIHHLDQEIDRLIDDERLLIPASGIIGTDRVSLFTDKLNFKRPGGSPFPWHQDAPYWSFGCSHLDQLASMQIYLDDATVENGCLWVIPGSHDRGHIPAPPKEGVLQRLYSDVDQLKDLEKKALVAPAGSVIFFDGYIVHGSQSNRTQSDRRAIILTYQPADLPLWNQDRVRIPMELRD